MVIVSISDIHGDLKSIDKLSNNIANADIILLTGDLTNFGHKENASKVLNSIRKYNNNVFAVSGNCDYPDVGYYLSDEGINIHAKSIVYDNLNIIGIGGSLHCPINTPNVFTEDDFNELLNKAVNNINPDYPLILVSHQPPYNTLCDLTHFRMHVGSKAIREFIDNTQPEICFTGHIHEGRGIDLIGKTKIINPGPLKTGSYAYAEIKSKVEVLEIRYA